MKKHDKSCEAAQGVTAEGINPFFTDPSDMAKHGGVTAR